MKQFLSTDTGSFTFSASAKQVTFVNITPSLKQILSIVNTTRNVMIYNPMAAATGGTLSGSVLTLTYDTTAHSNTDQLMIIVDAQGPSTFPAGFERVSDEPRQVFYDPFDAALDTTNQWTTPTVGNSAVLATVTTGTLSMGTGTTASGWSKLFSLPTFKPSVPAWTGFSFAIALPDGAAPTANAYRFWGAGTIPSTPTTTTPLTDAVGFEITTAGKLVAVVYAGGVRTQVADLSSTGNSAQPLDTAAHRYLVYVRTDRIFWYIDSLNTPVATSNFQSPQVQTLPMTLLAVGGATPPVSNTQIQCMGLAVWDTGKNATQLADGTFPHRKVQVGRSGGLAVRGASITGTSGAIAAAATGTIGPVDVSEAGNVTFVLKNTVAASAWAGTPVLVFEQSDDNISWALLAVTRSDTGMTNSTHTLQVGAPSTSIMFDAALEGVNYVRCRVTTGPTTNGITVVIQPSGMPFTPVVSTIANTGKHTLGSYAYSSFRTLGTAGTPHNIFTIENSTGSGVKMAIRALTINVDSTVALATVSPSIKTSRLASIPTGGTVGTVSKFITTAPTAKGVPRNGTASDSGTATAITATATSTLWTVSVDRQQTAAGFVSHPDYPLLPALATTSDFVLVAGEALLIQGVVANATTTSFVVNCAWDEYT
ncbi:hypothetical protein [Acinetobacter sp.]|uniref:hypothetical protein n=1 Tax=Acinetobacter sp. TaxID=472 RepID=UPI003750E435